MPTNGTSIRRLNTGEKPAFLNICQYGTTEMSTTGMNSTNKTSRCHGCNKSPMIESPSVLARFVGNGTGQFRKTPGRKPVSGFPIAGIIPNRELPKRKKACASAQALYLIQNLRFPRSLNGPVKPGLLARPPRKANTPTWDLCRRDSCSLEEEAPPEAQDPSRPGSLP